MIADGTPVQDLLLPGGVAELPHHPEAVAEFAEKAAEAELVETAAKAERTKIADAAAATPA